MTGASAGKSVGSHARGAGRAKPGPFSGRRTFERLAALAVAASLTALGACGQKGPLVLPDDAAATPPPPASTSSAADGENREADDDRSEPESRRDGR